MQVALKIKVPATVKKKGDYYISCCPILYICSQGATKKKALDNLVEAASLFLISCFERGTLDAVLKKCGFVAKKAVMMKPFPERFESVDVSIPFWIKHEKDTRACHA
ncbi:MAG TPA: hypothetical protein VI728_04520 [Syntrophales bacterium]|nr:hypothetical protein [Syntrophales bacterium]